MPQVNEISWIFLMYKTLFIFSSIMILISYMVSLEIKKSNLFKTNFFKITILF